MDYYFELPDKLIDLIDAALADIDSLDRSAYAAFGNQWHCPDWRGRRVLSVSGGRRNRRARRY